MKHGGPRRATEEEEEFREGKRKRGRGGEDFFVGDEFMLVCEKTTELIIGAAVKVHRELESVYEVCLAHEISERGLRVQKQVDVLIGYDDCVTGSCRKGITSA